MKSERRHELEHNQLADWAVHTVEAIKPYANVILGGTLAVIILVVAVSVWVGQNEAKSIVAWDAYYAGFGSQDSDDGLQGVVKKYPDTVAAVWAAVSDGDVHLIRGCDALYTDKVLANQDLEDAIKCYQSVQNAGNSPLAERAAYGLARAYESLEKLPEAKAAYENQLDRWKEGAYADAAKSQLKNLGRKSICEFYDLFAKYTPEPPAKSSLLDDPKKFESTDIPTPDDKVKSDEPKIEEPKKDE